ncbi:MAG: hypothetical protein K6E59_06370 [Bacilli bacterium]|nr:hypothetical protein [Bacilli bacterium]
MDVLQLHPHGYCLGVRAAIDLALQAKKDHPSSNVYLLGLLVHNEEAVAELEKAGLIPLDERKKDLLSYLLDMQEGDVVVFSAHGHPSAYDDLAKAKGLICVDATCRYVKENLEAGKETKGSLLYIGVAGHLESEAFLANNPDSGFYDVKSHTGDLLRLKGKKETPTIITQTTLSGDEIEEAMDDIRVFFPDATISKERCHSTSLRQKAVAFLPSDVDALIVLGSKRSNNSVKLYELGLSMDKETYLCLGLEDVKELNLKGKRRVALCSGASTSDATFDAVLSYLRSV